MRANKQTTVHSTVHNGVEIVYDMQRDRWNYTLRGRDRHAKSLGEAIRQIEKPGGKPFERVEVMRPQYSFYDDEQDKFRKVTVTSIADDQYSNHVWIVDAGNRSKVRADGLYVITTKNQNLMKSIIDLSGKIKTLGKLKSQLYDQLETLRIEREGDE